METDHHSRDSGVASGSIPTSSVTRQLAAASLLDMSHQGNFPIADEMPTDLSVGQQNHHQHNMDQHNNQHHVDYHYQSSPPSPQAQQQYHYMSTSSENTSASATDMHHHSTQASQQQQQHQQHHASLYEQPTINPALLEAATIASRGEDDVKQAAIQIMQLHRSQQKSNSMATLNSVHSSMYGDLQHHVPPSIHHSLITPLIDHYGDAQEANDLIEHYKRSELAKGYAPVPKFE